MLRHRYNKLEAEAKRYDSFTKVMGKKLYKAMVLVLFGAISISTMELH